jgi:lipoprotein-releasing system ATP-binding protein
MSNILLQAFDIHKSYAQGAGQLPILKGVNIEILEGEAVCIVGSSGAGKSTLLHIVGTLDQPSSGELRFKDRNILAMSNDELAQFRNSEMGFVFQFHHLVGEFSARENVMMPLLVAGVPEKEAESKAQYWLEKLGLKDRGHHFPSELSGGELQRVSIARALVRGPKILFADEPTGNLDSVNSLAIQDLFFELQQEQGLALLVVTHDLNFAQRFTRVLKIHDGRWA